MGLKSIDEKVKECRKCRLWKNGEGVPGEGPSDARVMFIGEAPGKEESIQGRPFVGRAGRFLTQELEKVGVKRKDVYITNVVKHRPPKNRKPQKDEIKACLPYLKEQIEIIKPKLIVLLGDVAVKTLLGKEFSISKNHGKIIKGKFLIAPHPSAAMRFSKMRKIFEEDMKIFAE